jgi:hypothetical protein
LSNLRAVIADGGSTVNNRVTWDHNADVGSSHKVKVWAERRYALSGIVNVANTELTGVGTGAATRGAQLDSESGASSFTNSGDTDTLGSQGSWIHIGVGDRGVAGEALISMVWKYTVELYQADGIALLSTYTKEVSQGYVIDPCLVVTVNGFFLSQGSIDGSGNCNSVPVNRVAWTHTNGSGYTISIEVATTLSPVDGDFALVASGLTPSLGYWDHEMSGFYGNVGGSDRYWTYRAWAVRIANGTAQSPKIQETAPGETYKALNCSGGYF